MPHPRIVAAGVALLVAGIVVVVLAAEGTLTAIGWGMQGVAAVILVSYAFLLVGESEDRDRARNPRG